MEDPANIPQAESPDAKSGKKEHKRRSFFKRAAFAAVIAGIAGGIGWKAYAHGGWHHAHHAALADPAQLDRHLDRMLGHFYSRIEATEEQKQKLGPIARDAAKDLLPLRGKLHDARRKAMDLLTADKVDAAALESLRAEQLKLAEDGSRRLTQAIAEASQVLTPAQRREFASRLSGRQSRWHGWG